MGKKSSPNRGSVININLVMQRTSGRSKKKSATEERVTCVNEVKMQLCDQHGTLYSGVQYTMWAEMIVAGSHESLEEPPQCPMFGTKRPHGQSNSLAV